MTLFAKQVGRGPRLYHKWDGSPGSGIVKARCGNHMTAPSELHPHVPQPPGAQSCRRCFSDPLPRTYVFKWRQTSWPAGTTVETRISAVSQPEAREAYHSLTRTLGDMAELVNVSEA